MASLREKVIELESGGWQARDAAKAGELEAGAANRRAQAAEAQARTLMRRVEEVEEKLFASSQVRRGHLTDR